MYINTDDITYEELIKLAEEKREIKGSKTEI